MKKKFPTLYSRTSTGAVQTWTIEVENDRYRTTYGQVDGKKTTTEWYQCYATNEDRANERTSIGQALFEAEAQWKKRTESGYYEDVKDIDKVAFIEPMLAKNYGDYKDDIVYPVYSQAKLDGIRCVVTKDTMQSRNGKMFKSAPHILEALRFFFKKYPNVRLDGELYCDKLNNDFNKICSLVKKSKPTKEDLTESADTIEYWVYDIVDATKTFSERSKFITEHLTEFDCIKIVETTKVHNAKELDKLYGEYVTVGYEGQMVRLDEEYEHKRSKTLLKRKEFETEEYKIVEIGEGEGNKTGMVGFAILETKDGDRFRSNVKGSHDFLTELWHNRKTLIGEQATVKYFNLTPGRNIPRFPYIIGIRNYE